MLRHHRLTIEFLCVRPSQTSDVAADSGKKDADGTPEKKKKEKESDDSKTASIVVPGLPGPGSYDYSAYGGYGAFHC